MWSAGGHHWASLGATAPASADSMLWGSCSGSHASRVTPGPLVGRALVALCSLLQVSLTCLPSSILSRKFTVFPSARPPNLDRPLPSCSLFLCLSFFLHFLFLPHSLMYSFFHKAQEDLIFKMITRNKSKKNDENQSSSSLRPGVFLKKMTLPAAKRHYSFGAEVSVLPKGANSFSQ